MLGAGVVQGVTGARLDDLDVHGVLGDLAPEVGAAEILVKGVVKAQVGVNVDDPRGRLSPPVVGCAGHYSGPGPGGNARGAGRGV